MTLFKGKTIISTIFYLLISFFLTMQLERYAIEKINYFIAWSIVINVIMLLLLIKAKLAEVFHLGRVETGTLLWVAFFGGFPTLFLIMMFFGVTIIEEQHRGLMLILFLIHFIIMLCIIVVLGAGHNL